MDSTKPVDFLEYSDDESQQYDDGDNSEPDEGGDIEDSVDAQSPNENGDSTNVSHIDSNGSQADLSAVSELDLPTNEPDEVGDSHDTAALNVSSDSNSSRFDGNINQANEMRRAFSSIGFVPWLPRNAKYSRESFSKF